MLNKNFSMKEIKAFFTDIYANIKIGNFNQMGKLHDQCPPFFSIFHLK